MVLTVIVRRLKPGMYEQFREAWEPKVWPEGMRTNWLARNDDDPTSDTRTSRVTFTATKGTTYNIVVDGYAAAMGRWYDQVTAKHGRPNIR